MSTPSLHCVFKRVDFALIAKRQVSICAERFAADNPRDVRLGNAGSVFHRPIRDAMFVHVRLRITTERKPIDLNSLYAGEISCPS